MTPVQRARKAFRRLSPSERIEIGRALRDETVGGFLLLLGAVVALIWANSPWDQAYDDLQHIVVGPASLHLDLDLHTWAADGLLAVFFLVAGLELKRELVVGDLRNPSEAVLPVVAAVCGIITPAIVYVLVNVVADDGSYDGWAVPTATDIAFALAVLAVIGSFLPTALRAFLLTLAVVDDLLAIIIIAVFFTDDLSITPLLGAAAVLLGYAFLQHRRIASWWIVLPIGLLTWVLVFESGVHATVAGIAVGLLTRVRHDEEEPESPAERYEHALRPFSAGLCVPLFALMSAGIALSVDSFTSMFTEPIPLGVVLGLVLGKCMGVFGGTYVTARFTRAELSEDLRWSDIFGVALLSGIGFTVSLLIGELAFDDDPATIQLVKAAVLAGSLISAALAACVLVVRNAAHRRLAEEEQDSDAVSFSSESASDAGESHDSSGA